MNPFIANLLGVQAPFDEEQMESQGSDIIVSRRKPERPGPVAEDDSFWTVDNMSSLREVDANTQATEDYRKDVPRKGMFGVKGTLRDILGLVSDAFLVQGGGQAAYMPLREREKISDAMAGMTRSPEDFLAGIERIAAINPSMANELRNQYETQQIRRMQQDSLNQSRESAAQGRNYNMLKDFKSFSSNLLNNPNAYGPNGTLSDDVYEMIAQQARAAGTTPEAIGITRGMDQRRGRLMAAGMMSPYQQEMLPQQERRTQVQERNAQSNAERARKAGPAPRQPRAENIAERYTRIANTPEDKRTVGDQRWFETEDAKRVKQGTPAGGATTKTTPRATVGRPNNPRNFQAPRSR